MNIFTYTTGNPTRDALQNQIAILEGTENAKSFCFTTGMAALTTMMIAMVAHID